MTSIIYKNMTLCKIISQYKLLYYNEKTKIIAKRFVIGADDRLTLPIYPYSETFKRVVLFPQQRQPRPARRQRLPDGSGPRQILDDRRPNVFGALDRAANFARDS